jgi:hypothetical protein
VRAPRISALSAEMRSLLEKNAAIPQEVYPKAAILERGPAYDRQCGLGQVRGQPCSGAAHMPASIASSRLTKIEGSTTWSPRRCAQEPKYRSQPRGRHCTPSLAGCEALKKPQKRNNSEPSGSS